MHEAKNVVHGVADSANGSCNKLELSYTSTSRSTKMTKQLIVMKCNIKFNNAANLIIIWQVRSGKSIFCRC